MSTEPDGAHEPLSQVAATLASVEAELRARTEFPPSPDESFSKVMKGCFVKAFEFAQLACGTRVDAIAFFLAPSLRGICEDYIALRYFEQRLPAEERDEQLRRRALNAVLDSCRKQKAFFERARPFQPVLPAPLQGGEPHHNRTVKDMANAVGLSFLYDFFYAVTSDIVHFNPRIVLRGAWGSNEKVRFSARNFDVYYRDFCRIYGLYFLSAYSRAFGPVLGMSLEFQQSIDSLHASIDAELRWPEAVTFEEMNQEPPSLVLRALLRSQHALQQDRQHDESESANDES